MPNGELPSLSTGLVASFAIGAPYDKAAEKMLKLAGFARELGFVLVGAEVGFDDADNHQELIDDTVLTEKLDERLDARLPEIVNNGKFANYVTSVLARSNIFTIRDALIMGKSAVADIRSIGSKAVDAVAQLVSGLDDKSISWIDEPSLADVVVLSGRLDRVPSIILGEVGRMSSTTRLTIRDILLASDEELARLSKGVMPQGSELVTERVGILRRDACRFAAAYGAEKHRLLKLQRK